MKTLYITGLAGFLGNNLLSLIDDDTRIIALVLEKEKDYPYLQKENIQLVVGNILNKEDIKRFLNIKGENKYIIHMAGRISTLKRSDSLTMDINYEGTKNMVDIANEIGDFKKFIYISSVDSLPKVEHGKEITEISYYDETKVEGVYSKSKALANNYILDNLKNTESVILLPSALFGPNDPTLTPINKAINKCLNKKLPAITKGGYNLVDVRDVAKGIYNSIEKGRDKQSYLLGGNYIAVKDLMKKVTDHENMKEIKFIVPHFLIKLISPFIELKAKINRKNPLFTGFSMDCLMQNSSYSSIKARKKLDYSITPFDQTLEDTINYLKARK